jgi:hypothetical protein
VSSADVTEAIVSNPVRIEPLADGVVFEGLAREDARAGCHQVSSRRRSPRGDASMVRDTPPRSRRPVVV